MRLLVITQKVDSKDPVLGFFHRWIEELSKVFEKVIVICLEEGEHKLPSNVKVLSLGKDKGVSKFKYILNFYKFIFREINNYDKVFVHMNQEYVLLAGDIWRLLGKKVYLWRNHAKGNILTTLAVVLSNKVFATSPDAYVARFKKTEIMPVGIDTELFKPDNTIERKPDSILFLGRIAPVKKVLEFVDWFNKLDEKFRATIAGTSLPKDHDYERLVRSRASDRISFVGAVTQVEALKLYQSHETYVNQTPSGSMDKTILEAAACEDKILVSNEYLKVLENKKGKELRDFVVEHHSLEKLVDKLLKKLK